MSRPSNLGSVSYEVESSWAEAVSTWGTRLETIGDPVVPGDIQERIAQATTRQYREDGKMGIRGPWGGEFSITMALTGQGGTGGTGATTDTDLYALLVNALGGGSSDCAGTDIATSTDAGEFTLTGGTVESNNLVRIGALGDLRGNGQFYAVDNIATTTLLTDMLAAADVADIVYAPVHVYPLESAGTPIVSTRFLLLTANGQWAAKGCWPKGLSFAGLNVGEQPTVTITYGVSAWAEENRSFPRGTTSTPQDGTMVAAGSCFLQDVGVTTRQALDLRAWTLDINLESVALPGPGGLDAYQTIVGAIRTRANASLSLTIDSEAVGNNTLNDIYISGVMQHCLMTLSSTAGRAIGFYFKNCRPTKYVNQSASNGINRRTLMLEALTGPALSSEETAASWVLGMA